MADLVDSFLLTYSEEELSHDRTGVLHVRVPVSQVLRQGYPHPEAPVPVLALPALQAVSREQGRPVHAPGNSQVPPKLHVETRSLGGAYKIA